MVKLRCYPVLLLFLTAGLPAATASYFNFTPAAKDAYRKTVSLRFGEARSTLADIKRSEPDNLVPYFLENYLDFLTVFIHDDKAEFKGLEQNVDARLDLLAKGDPASPYLLYTQAEIRLQWSILHFRYGEYFSAATGARRAFTLLEENQRNFPWFLANKKSLGILHALAGNVPEEYRWLVKLLGGMSGTVPQGLSELEEVLRDAGHSDQLFEEEATAAYALMQVYLNNSAELAWTTVKSSKLNPRVNPMAAFVMATVAMRAGHNDDAILLLQESPAGAPFESSYNGRYLLGLAKLRRQDADANQPIEDFLNHYPGENGVKDGYQKLAWFHLINGNEAGYRTYMRYLAIKGAESSEPDRVALREAKSGEMPDPVLLQARLLFDGGYYQRALQVLGGVDPSYGGRRKPQIEYNYRMGRICQKLGKLPDALRYYRQAVQQGAADPWYFACGAALQMGILYEEKRDFANARLAFNKCLAIKPEEYAGSLHTQAKAGLSRVK